MGRDDMIGRVFDRLTVLRKHERPWNYYEAQCSCGTIKVVWKYSLLNGSTRSCGCLHRQIAKQRIPMLLKSNTKHGLAHDPRYSVWQNMMARCYSLRSDQYANYGGRGIKVCDRWHDVSNFIADMGERPRGYQIDRINNDGDYEPSNCRWTSPTNNALNRRVTVMLTVGDITKPVHVWAKDTGIPYRAMLERIELGWSPVDIVTKASRTKFSQTHCRNGHAYTEENSIYWKDVRFCRTCRREHRRKANAKKREART